MMLQNLSNLQQRLIAGIFGGALMVLLCYINEWTYFLLFFLIGFFSLKEFYQLLRIANLPYNSTTGLVTGSLIFSFVFLVEKQLLPSTSYLLLILLLFLFFIVELYLGSDKPFMKIAFTILGLVYIPLPLSLLNLATFSLGEYNYKLMLGILLILWSNDVGAYAFGKTLGRRKLFTRISPKKTWEGTLGGGLFALLISWGLSLVFADVARMVWFGLAVIIVVAGTYGDLVESMLKRSLHVKDSAQSIPGHGGFLDRFDGLFLAAPFIAAFIKFYA